MHKLTVAKLDKTCKVNTAALKPFNLYNMNKLQVAKMNNTINFTDAKLTKKLVKDACFINCYLKENGVLVDGVMDYATLAEFLGKTQTEGGYWQDVMPSVVTACRQNVVNESDKRCLTEIATFYKCSQTIMKGLAEELEKLKMPQTQKAPLKNSSAQKVVVSRNKSKATKRG